MFKTVEQIHPSDPWKRLFSLLISAVAHAVALVILVLLPLLFFNLLPEGELLTFLIAPPPPPPPAPPPAAPAPVRTVVAQRVNLSRAEFVAPNRLPVHIPGPGNETIAAGISGTLGSIPGAIPGGVPGGVPGGLPGSILGLVVPPAAPPPPPKPVKRPSQRVGGVVLESRLIKRVEPDYPELAKRARISGIVILDVTVDEDGNVADVRVLRGHPLLNDAAVQAVGQWKYSPTFLNGEPVSVTAAVTVIFSLR